MAVETNLITTDQMKRAREVDFTRRFTGTILNGLMNVLGVTRRIPMMDGTTLYVYKTTGTLQSGEVAEGEVIPLSQYERTKTSIGPITLKKWRKAASAEAILKSGYTEAVRETDEKLLNDVQVTVRTDFFNHLKGIEDLTLVTGDTLQMVLAKSWGNLQVLFENDAIQSVHFIHPLTIAEYLGAANITVQTAFGMSYIEDFLGLGTVLMTSQIPIGQVYSTARENLILYYVPISSDALQSFNMTADPSGLIGISSGYPTESRAQIETLVMSGTFFAVEMADGVVLGQIDTTPTLGSVTVTSAGTGATAVGDSLISVSGYTLGTGESYVYKTAKDTAPAVAYGQKLTGWSKLTNASGTNITPASTHNKITVAAVGSDGRAQAAGNATLNLKS